MGQAITLIGIMIIAVLGPALVMSIIGFATITALGRNPSAAPKIYLGVILMMVFAQATSIIALLVVFQIFGA
jgi:F0F1-type ATP synthase membrane subunit c/vacuolar-type H+-ATPase subunit K